MKDNEISSKNREISSRNHETHKNSESRKLIFYAGNTRAGGQAHGGDLLGEERAEPAGAAPAPPTLATYAIWTVSKAGETVYQTGAIPKTEHSKMHYMYELPKR